MGLMTWNVCQSFLLLANLFSLLRGAHTHRDCGAYSSCIFSLIQRRKAKKIALSYAHLEMRLSKSTRGAHGRSLMQWIAIASTPTTRRKCLQSLSRGAVVSTGLKP